MSVETMSRPTVNGHNCINGNHHHRGDGVNTIDKTKVQSTKNVMNDNIESLLDSLSLESCYALAIKFYRSFESKAFTPSYEERNRLVALTLQSKYGSFDPERVHSETGALDVVGRDRRTAWSSLGDMSQDQAKREFIFMMDTLCSRFKAFLLAHVKQEEAKREEIEKVKRQQEQEQMVRKQEVERQEAQKKAIQDVLNRQTHDQFIAYAQQQYPGEEDRQEYLIKQLQENHYQQYMQQILQQQHLFSQQEPSNPVTADTGSQGNTQQEVMNSYTSQEIEENRNPEDSHSREGSQDQESENQEIVDRQEYLDNEEGNSHSDEEGDESGERGQEEHETSSIVIEEAKMWSKKEEIEDFKRSVRSEGGGEGVIKLGHGEIVTINVPTHEEGNFIFWEFATDFYDIGFGVLFEFTDNPGSGVSVHVTESDDEEEDEDVRTGVEALNLDGETTLSNSITDAEKGVIFPQSDEQSNPNLEVILPIFRRDSHEAVFQGCHSYPGKGVYRLKFDNSYSLWRSKTLYYRVYYTRS